MSSRQPNSSSGEDLATAESSNGTRISPLSQQRNTRRSNSAMSSTRARGGVSKEEDDGDQQIAGELDHDAIMVAEPEEDEETNENGDSGDSGNSGYQNNTNRSRRNATSSKRKRGSANTTATSRTRAGKRSRQPTADGQNDNVAQEGTAIKSEAEDDSTHQVKSTSESGEEGMTRTESRVSRQRSISGIKELAGLGLRTLGNGEEEPLIPRRTRRNGNSPNEGQASSKEGEEKRESSIEENNEADVKRSTRNTSSEAKSTTKNDQDEVNEDEVAEEGVTRCLCGSADENVGLMIQCETCKCWQHCICMGMRTEEDCPDVYFCEQCRPELHIDLLRLLGFLPANRSGKKGGSSKTQSGRISAKDAAKELKDAKEAVLSLAKENERRRKEGRDPVTGWSVAQEQEQLQLQEQHHHPSQSHHGAAGARSTSAGQHRRQASESQPRASRSQSRDELTIPKSPPKRRSTMNSRDSAYGWETIPSELLNEEDGDEEDLGNSRKRKRGGMGEDGEVRSPSPLGLDSNEGLTKKRRTSSAGIDEEEQAEGEEEEDENEAEDAAMTHTNSQGARKASSKARIGRDGDASRPKHPNQYTARRAAAAAAAASTQSGIGNAGSSSPSPSPSKHRMADGTRRGTTLRDVISNGSRMATPTPGDHAKSANPSTAWSMPDHLSHLAYLLPTNTGPEPLKLKVASTKGMTTTSNSKGAQSTAIKDANSDRIIQASPQAFQVLSLVEPNTKIKFPGKRTTLGEMKKRVRNILDFVSRLQVESAERERRMKFLGISTNKEIDEDNTPEEEEEARFESAAGRQVAVLSDTKPGGQDSRENPDTKQDGDVDMKEEEEGADGKVTSSTHSTEPTSPTANDILADTSNSTSSANHSSTSDNSLKRFTKLHSSSMSLVDELTRELLTFQQKYGTGASSSAALASSSSVY